MSQISLPPSPIADVYRKAIVAAAAFLVCIEVMYFWVSGVPSFFVPSIDRVGQTAIGRDFLNIWMGGKSAFTGGPSAFFDFWNYNIYLRSYFGTVDVHDYIWSYPPHILLFIWPFGLMPYLLGFAVWSLLGVVMFLWAASAGGVERKNLLFIAVAPAVAVNLFFGQNGTFFAALLICGLINLDRRPLLAGVMFGIMTIKPQLGLLLPVMLVLTGRWRVIASAAATTVALVGATSWLCGVEIWWEYLAKVVPIQRQAQEVGSGLLLLQIPSAFYAGRIVGLPIQIDWIIQAAVSLAVLAAVVWTYWRPRDPLLSTALLVTAIFLFSPYTMHYDFVIFGWVLALMLQRGGLTTRDHVMVLVVWTLPVSMLLVTWLLKVPFAFLVLTVFAGWLLRRLAQEDAAASDAAGRLSAWNPFGWRTPAPAPVRVDSR
jgi:alpha-1,2-mannosyltransferase